MSDMKQNCNKLSRGTLVVLCMVVTFICLILVGIGLFAPGWWTLDVTEYGQVELYPMPAPFMRIRIGMAIRPVAVLSPRWHAQ